MYTLKFRGLTVSYEIWGSGEPIILLHSGGSSSAQWEKSAAALAPAYELIAPDLFGFGNTDAWPERGGLTHDLQAVLVAAVLHTLGKAQTHVVGHSYGGGTAMRLIVRHPGLVRSLCLFEPILPALLEEAKDPLSEAAMEIGRTFVKSVDEGVPERGWEAFIDSRNGPGTWARMSERSRSRFVAQSQQTREGFISNWNNTTTLAECRAVQVPTTVACSESAIPVDRRLTELLHEAIAASRSISIPQAGHMAPLTHPEAVADIIGQHVAWAINNVDPTHG